MIKGRFMDDEKNMNNDRDSNNFDSFMFGLAITRCFSFKLKAGKELIGLSGRLFLRFVQVTRVTNTLFYFSSPWG